MDLPRVHMAQKSLLRHMTAPPRCLPAVVSSAGAAGTPTSLPGAMQHMAAATPEHHTTTSSMPCLSALLRCTMS